MTSASSITKPLVVGRRETWRVAHGAVDVGDHPAATADHVVVVVADPALVARDVPEGLDLAHELRLGEHLEHVVDGLVADVAVPRADGADQRVGVGVGEAAYGVQHGQPLLGDPQPGPA